MKLVLLKLYMVYLVIFVYDGLDTVMDRITIIEKRLDALDFKGVEKLNPPREEILEIENDSEPFVRVVISNQNFLAFCDIGSTVSIMPSFIYDSLYLASMDKFPSFHEHSNGDISEIQGRLKDVQVMFLKRSVDIDFAIMKANKGNIVLGRDFLRAMKGFIDIGKGQIRLRGKAKGTYNFPRKNKDEIIENPFEILGEPSDDFGEL